MAYVNSVRASQPSFFSLVSARFADWRGAVQRRQIYRQTLTELSSLTDRDLTDLGLHRSMLSSVAREAAYGK